MSDNENKVTKIDTAKQLIEIFGEPKPMDIKKKLMDLAIKDMMDEMDRHELGLIRINEESCYPCADCCRSDNCSDNNDCSGEELHHVETNYDYPMDDEFSICHYAGTDCSSIDFFYNNTFIQNEENTVACGIVILQRTPIIAGTVTGVLKSNGMELARVLPSASSDKEIIFNCSDESDQTYIGQVDHLAGIITIPNELQDDGEMIFLANYEVVRID